MTSKNNEIKRKVKAIETRYNEVFVEGSYKHFRKVQRMFSLDVEI